MSIKNEYFLKTGNDDRERLTIVSKLYNPNAFRFMKKAGLKAGMIVLEIGAGTGHMAVEVAKEIGPRGKIVVSDKSEDQLKVAQEIAYNAGIRNAEFLKLDIDQDLIKFQEEFDCVYGRWIVEFSQNPDMVLQHIFRSLKKGGIFAYEGVDVSDREYFSYPYSPLVEQWFHLIHRNWQAHNMDYKFIKRLYGMLKSSYNMQEINIEASQAILTSSYEKAVLRLGLMSGRESYLENKLITAGALDDMLADLYKLEQSDTIIGFVRNLLISGRKSV